MALPRRADSTAGSAARSASGRDGHARAVARGPGRLHPLPLPALRGRPELGAAAGDGAQGLPRPEEEPLVRVRQGGAVPRAARRRGGGPHRRGERPPLQRVPRHASSGFFGMFECINDAGGGPRRCSTPRRSWVRARGFTADAGAGELLHQLRVRGAGGGLRRAAGGDDGRTTRATTPRSTRRAASPRRRTSGPGSSSALGAAAGEGGAHRREDPPARGRRRPPGRT